MRNKRPQPPPSPATREDVILFSVSGFKFVIAAGAVHEIRGLQGLQPFSLGRISVQLAKLKYTLERSGTTYFVVDAAFHFRLTPSHPSRLLILRNIPAAVLVDSTDRMMGISALHGLPQAFTHEERGWYRGLTVVDDQVIPVINPQGFLSKAEVAVGLTDLARGRVADEHSSSAAKGVVSA